MVVIISVIGCADTYNFQADLRRHERDYSLAQKEIVDLQKQVEVAFSFLMIDQLLKIVSFFCLISIVDNTSHTELFVTIEVMTLSKLNTFYKCYQLVTENYTVVSF